MNEYNEGHQTECLQTLTIIQEIAESNLSNHPAIIKADSIDTLEYALTLIAQVYQEVCEIDD